MKRLNEKGNALFLTILTIVLVSVLGISLLNVTANSNKTTVNERYDQSIYYIAEAGLNLEKATLYSAITTAYNKTLEELRKKSTQELSTFNFTTTFESFLCSTTPSYCSTHEKEYDHFQKQYNKQPLAKTRILKSCSPTPEMNCTFTIESDGYYNEQPSKSRQVTQSITVTSSGYLTPPNGDDNSNSNPPNPSGNTPPLEGVVALVQGNIKVNGNSDIYGNIASNTNDHSIKDKKLEKNLHGQVITIEKPIDLHAYLPPFPNTNFSQLSLPNDISKISSSDIYVNKLKGSVTIDVGNQNRTLYINELDLDKGVINVIGSGSLNIIVNSEIKIDGTIVRADNNPNKLNIYYQGTKTLEINGSSNNKKNSNIGGSLHILKSKIDFDGGDVVGNIYYHGTEQLNINGNGTTHANYIVAPNAFVQTNGNADFYGIILADSMQINGNHDINFSASMAVPLPNPNPNPNPTTPPNYSQDPIIIESPINEN